MPIAIFALYALAASAQPSPAHEAPPAGRPPGAPATADPLRQCGGKNCDGLPFLEKSCPAGFTCTATDPKVDYKMCKVNDPEPGTKAFFEQCDGKKYTGSRS
jgi:hypothetical protein